MKTYKVYVQGLHIDVEFLTVEAASEVDATARVMLDLEKMRGIASTPHNVVRVEQITD